MESKNFELRQIDFKPFINQFQSLDYLKSSVGQVLKTDINFNQILSYEAKEGEKVKLLFLGLFNGVTRLRFELIRPDPEFERLFDVGNFIGIDHSDAYWNYDGDVVFVSDQAIEIDVVGTGSGAGQNQEGSFSGKGILFRNYQVPELLQISYNLGPSRNESQINFFDGGQQSYLCDFSSGQNFVSLTGAINNWRRPNTPKLTLESRQPDPQINGVFNERTLLNNFTIEDLDLIVPYWNEGWQENYEEGTVPDVFRNENTLKFYVEIKIWLDKNKTKAPSVYTFEREGDIGWLNENGNGGYNDIKVDSTTYFNTDRGLPSSSLSINESHIVTTDISRQTGTFTTSDSATITVFKKTPYNEYFESKLNNSQTYLYSSRRTSLSGTNQASEGLTAIGTIVSTITNSGKNLKFQFAHTSTSYGKTRLETGDQYIILVNIFNTNGTGQSTNILIDQNEYSIDTDEDGLIECLSGRVLDPDVVPQDQLGVPTITANDGYSESHLWNEDGVIAWWQLRQFGGVSRPLADNTKIVSLNFRLIANRNSAKNGTTDYSDPNNYIVIQEKNVPFDIVGASDNVPIYEGAEVRAFNLENDDVFKQIKVRTYGQGVGFAYIDVACAFKVDWQNWIRLDNVPFDFYDPSDSFNGYNKRSSNYSEKPISDKFDIRAVMFVEMQNLTNQFTTDYAFEIPIKVYNYGEDEYTRLGNFADWSAELFTSKLDGTDLAGNVLLNEDTVFKIHWINNGRVSVANLWFIHRIEEAEQPSFDIWELSTLRLPQDQNPLQPLQGEINLKTYSDGAGGFFSEARIDSSKLDQGQSYKLSGRIGENENGTGFGVGYSVGFTTGFDA